MKTKILLALVCLTTCSLQAATIKFALIGKGGPGLLASNETSASSGTPGSGGLTGAGISFDDVTRVLTINVGWGTGNGFTNLTGNATAAHIHGPTASSFPDSYNETGSVAISLDSAPFTFTASASGGSITGSDTLNPGRANALLAGKLYLNVHTSANSGGEIRGNLVPVTETVPPSIVVVTNADSGAGSLRKAITDAAATPGADTITFDPHVFTGGVTNVIALTGPANGSAIDINDSAGVTITGSSLASVVTLDGGSAGFRLFMVADGSVVTLDSLTLSHAGGTGVSSGGAISNAGTLRLTNCTLNGHTALLAGGAIISNDSLTLTHCTLTDNQADNGGALANASKSGVLHGAFTLTHCTIAGNRAVAVSGAGGGILNSADCTVNISQTLVTTNTANTSADYHNVGTTNLSAQNFVGAGLTNFSGGSTTGPAPLTGNAMLGVLADNGGLTQTMLPQVGSPCIDPTGGATTSSFSTDQRGITRVLDGDPVAGAIVDIGAVEAPTFDPTNSIAFTAPSVSFKEEAGTVQVSLTRTGYAGNSASVQVTSSPGSATLADYNAVSTTVNFAASQTTATVDVTLIADSAVKEVNESFTLTLSSPTGSSTILGTQTTCAVTIIDAFDIILPTVTITAPLANAIVLEANGPSVTVTGNAKDNQGLSAVQVSVDGGAYSAATLTIGSTGKTATFSKSVNLGSGGPHLIAVRSVDTRGNLSAVVTRSVIHRIARPLTVAITGPADSGTITTGFLGTTDRNVGERYTITATPKPGFVFAGWEFNDPAGTGVTVLSIELPALNFIMQQGLSLTATFVANPYPPLITGTFNGVLAAVIGTSRVDTAGMLQNGKVTSTGAFTATLKIDGLSVPLKGSLYTSNGTVANARFGVGAARNSVMSISRAGKPSLLVSLGLNLSGSGQMVIYVSQYVRGLATTLSLGAASPSAYSAAHKAPSALAGTVSQPYTLLFPARVQSPVIAAQYYPQSPGYATMTLTATGLVTYAGKLADGTAISGSSALIAGDLWPMFVSLYSGKGLLLGLVAITDANASTYDVVGSSDFFWVRPPLAASQWYPDGWTDALKLSCVGARYVVPPKLPATSVFPGLQAISPNLTLSFTGGLLTSTQTFDQTVSPLNAVINVPLNPIAPTTKIAKATGLISGTFLHTDGTKPKYQGVIMQKGALKGAAGYFMTTSPKVVNGLGESGTMNAVAK